MDKEERIFEWGHSRRFNAYSNYFASIFGGRVQKVSIDAGFTCPNRDGTRGTGGCTFCNNDAFSPSYCIPEKSITTQALQGIEFHKRRYRKSVGYLAYFQAYTNTYDRVEKLEKLYREALAVPGIIGLIIGTRPDSVDREKLELLKSISQNYYVAVEYGVESVYNTTLERINRGHTFEESVAAIELTRSLGLHSGAHFIFGLPGESRRQMLEAAGIISKLPLTTVKFHQLQVIKGTVMEMQYKSDPGSFTLFNWEEYREFFISFLERLNPALVVERFTSEAPPPLIASPRWGRKRSEGLMAEFEALMEERDTWQGRLYNSESN